MNWKDYGLIGGVVTHKVGAYKKLVRRKEAGWDSPLTKPYTFEAQL